MDLRPPILVLGIGNILLRDEGVGVRAIEALRRHALPAGVELCDGGTAGLALADVLAGRRKVIVIDAMQAGLPPGTIRRLTPADLLPPSAAGVSVHEAGLVEALHSAHLLGETPEDVVIIGVQPGDVSPGLELTAAVAAALPQVIDLVLAEPPP